MAEPRRTPPARRPSKPARTTRDPDSEALNKNLIELARQIKHRREALRIKQSELASSCKISAAYLSMIEAAADPERQAQPVRPSKENVRLLAKNLRLDPREWLELAGYVATEDVGAPESAVYVSTERLKPWSRLHFERMEDDLAGLLREDVTPLEVPVFAFLRHLPAISETARVVGVALRSGERPGTLCALSTSDLVVQRTSDLLGKRVATIGLYTEALMVALFALSQERSPWIVWSVSKETDRDERGLHRAGLHARWWSPGVDPSGLDPLTPEPGVATFHVTYNSGALTHLMRQGAVDLILVPPSPFEVEKVRQESWVKGPSSRYQRVARKLEFDIAPNYKDFPSSLLVTTVECLGDANICRHIVAELEAIERTNQRAARFLAHAPVPELEEILEPDMRAHVAQQLPTDVSIADPHAFAAQLQRMLDIALEVQAGASIRPDGDARPTDLAFNHPSDGLRQLIIPELELMEMSGRRSSSSRKPS